MKLVSDQDLAKQFDISVSKLHDLRKKHQWPHVRLGRFEIRFTEQQVETIVRSMSVAPTPKQQSAAREAGLTERSARRTA